MKSSVDFQKLAGWFVEQTQRSKDTYEEVRRTPEFLASLRSISESSLWQSAPTRYGGFFTPIDAARRWMELQVSSSDVGENLAALLLFAYKTNTAISLAEAYFAIKKSYDPPDARNKPYRDHLVHTSVVYKLGLGLLDSELDGLPFRGTLAQKVAATIGIPAKAFANYQGDPDWQEVLDRAWLLASFWHDVAYYVDPAFDLERGFLNCPPLGGSPVACALQERVVRELPRLAKEAGLPNVAVLQGHFMQDGPHTLDDPKENHGRLDHGQFLSCVLLEALYTPRDGHTDMERLTSDDKLVLFLVLIATFRHTTWSKPREKERSMPVRPEFSGDPWSVFFSFVDSLAEVRLIWDTSEPARRRFPESVQRRLNIWLPFALGCG